MGTGGRGTERLVFGRNGEVQYTSSHYDNFLRLR
ncbi:ribonuclease domain-containing protein [Actinomadura sp. NPDC023710]